MESSAVPQAGTPAWKILSTDDIAHDRASQEETRFPCLLSMFVGRRVAERGHLSWMVQTCQQGGETPRNPNKDGGRGERPRHNIRVEKKQIK